MNSIEDVRATFAEHVEGIKVSPGMVDRAIADGRAIRRRRRLGGAGAAVCCALAVLVPTLVAHAFSDGEAKVASGPASSRPVRTGTTVIVGDPPGVPFAVGSTIFDGATQVQAPGEVTAFVKVGAEYAVLSPDGTGQTRLDVVATSGATYAVDVGDLYGLAGAEVDGRPVIAWGGETVRKLWLDQETAVEVSPDTGGAMAEVLGMVGADVVYAVRSDDGLPYVWNESTGVRPLAVNAVLTDLGPGVAQLQDLADGCGYAIQFDDPRAHLWDSCGAVPTGGQLTTDGRHHIDGLRVTDLTAPGAPVIELVLPATMLAEDSTPQALSYGWDTAGSVLIAGAPASGTAFSSMARCAIDTGTCESVSQFDANLQDHPFAVVFAGP